ncbi:hypothetical protein GCM10025734_59150 [Kitasatospora paranensis]
MTENVLGLSLAKEHSAVDWSTRPLPEPWLRYAALDVEVLVELRDALEQELEGQGKLGWALEEFAALAAAPLPTPASTRGGARRSCTRCAAAGSSPRCASCGRPATGSPASGTCHPVGCSPTRQSSTRRSRCR